MAGLDNLLTKKQDALNMHPAYKYQFKLRIISLQT